MLGPVQFLMVGFKAPQLPDELRKEIESVHAGPAVSIIDAIVIHKDRRGEVQQEPVPDLTVEHSRGPGEIVSDFIVRAGAARAMGHEEWKGPTSLFKGDTWADPRTLLTKGTSALALLIEHRWARGLRETGADLGTYPVVNGWIGQELLADLGLLSSDDG